MSMNPKKYQAGYYPVAETYTKWVKKDRITNPPV